MAEHTLNWVICPHRNGLHLTLRAVETFFSQDLTPIGVLLIDNSPDGSCRWIRPPVGVTMAVCHTQPAQSVAESWNTGLRWAFSRGADYVLVVNNDVELRPDTYRHLVLDGGPFVTALSVRERGQIILAPPDPALKRPHPDFSCFLIHRSAYNLVGPFDENFKTAFCEDWDYHVRLHRAGIEACCLDLPYLHHASQTVKLASDPEARAINEQAYRNREYFRRKWGVKGGTPEYYALFGHEAPKEAAA